MEDYERLAEVLPIIMLKGDSFETPVRDVLRELSLLQHMTSFERKQVRYVSSIGAIPLLVTAGLGMTVGNVSYVLQNEPKVQFICKNPANRISKGIFWKTENQNSLIPIFIQLLKQEIAVKSLGRERIDGA